MHGSNYKSNITFRHNCREPTLNASDKTDCSKKKIILNVNYEEFEKLSNVCGSLNWYIITDTIRVITKLPNPEQSSEGKVKTHKYINRQNQSTTGKLWKRNDPDLVQAFQKKWWVESDFKVPNLPLSLRL